MADNTPFSVRMEQEDKEKLLKLIQDSGKSNKEFMTSLINIYDLNKAKIEMPEIAQDIEGLEALTKQISDYYVNMGKRIEAIRKSKDIEFAKETEIYKDKIETLKDENNNINEKFISLQEVYNNINSDYDKLNKQLSQLQESLNDKNLLVEEYKSKNDTLTGLLSEYKQYKIEIEKYKKSLEASQKQNTNLANEIKENNKIIENLKKDLNSKVVELGNKYKSNIEALKDKADIEKSKEILILQKQHQEEIQKINLKNNKTIEEYQAKYKQLLEELEKNKKTNLKTTAHKVPNQTKK